MRLLDWAFASGLEEHGFKDERLIDALVHERDLATAQKKKRTWGLNLFGYFADSFDRGQIELMVYQSLLLSEVPIAVVRIPDLSANTLKLQIDDSYSHREISFTRTANNILNVFIIGPENIESFFSTYPNKKFRSHYNLAVVLWDWSSMPVSLQEKLLDFTEIWTLSDFTSNALRELREWSGHTLTSMKFLSGSVFSDISPEPPATQETDGVAVLLQSVGISPGAFIFLTILNTYCEDRDNLLGSASAFQKARTPPLATPF